MLRLTTQLKIGDRTIYHATDINIRQSWRTLTDTADIVFPAKPAEKLNFKTGETVTIDLGYDYDLTTRFEGFIARISNDLNTITLHCEDHAWLLKKKAAPQKAIRNATIKSILQALDINNANISGDITVGNYRIEQNTVAKALNALKEQFGIAIFYRNATLHAGLPYTLLAQLNETKTVNLAFGKNIISDNIAIKQGEERSISIKAVIINTKDGSVKNITVGDTGGEEHTLHYINATEESVKEQAKSEIERLQNKANITGTLTLFGIPEVKVADTINLIDPITNIKQGQFLTDDIEIQYGENGFRQNITIGKQV